MTDLVVDSFAFLAYYRDEAGADEILQLIHDAVDGKVKLYATTYNLGEVYYMAWRKHSKIHADKVWKELMQLPLVIVEPDIQMTFEAATLKANSKLSYADAHAAALALHLKATLITGDREFDSLKKIKGFKVKYIV
jgi:predicted nucleic acid-binding protein